MSFGAELGVLVEGNAFREQLGVERNGLGGGAPVSSAEGLEELEAEYHVVSGYGVGGVAGSEPETFVNGSGQ